MLYQLLQVAKEAEMKELHISVEKENTASIKVIKKMEACMNGAFPLKMKWRIFIKLRYEFLISKSDN